MTLLKIKLLLSRLIYWSGEDVQIVTSKTTDRKAKVVYFIIGSCVFFIFIISFLSSVIFIYQIFESIVLAIPIGTMLGLMILNIYLLLLYSISPALIMGTDRTIKGDRYKYKKYENSIPIISLVLRIIFISFIAIIIVQPLLVGIVPWLYNLNLIGENDFYGSKIKYINTTFPIAWIATLIIVFLFTLPIILKFRIRYTTNFYDVKKEIERNVVINEYKEFKVYYKLLLDHYDQDIEFYESCIDPPFNTIKKSEVRNNQGQSLLLNKIYSELETSEINKYVVSETSRQL